MNQNTRQRIVGTLVLVVAALILLPIIFDGEGSYQPPVQTHIPPTPPQPQVERELPQRPVITADIENSRRAADPADSVDVADDAPQQAPEVAVTASDRQPEPSAATPSSSAPPSSETSASPAAPSAPAEPTEPAQVVAEPAPTPPSLDAQGLPEAWSVRLGAFASTSNATNLVARLQEAGHRAYTRQVDSSQGVLTAVFVGPLVDRAAAGQMMESLRQEFQLNGLIVRYEIEE